MEETRAIAHFSPFRASRVSSAGKDCFAGLRRAAQASSPIVGTAG